jgi:hypothetical protein
LVQHQASDQRTGFITGASLGSRLTGAVREFSMGANVPRTWLEAAGLAIFAACVGVGVLLAIRSGRGPRVVLAVAAIAFGVPLLLAALGIDDLFDSRNVIAALPLTAALAAPATLRLHAAPLAAYLALATLASVWVATDWRYEQADWRGALARAEAIDPHAAVVALGSEPVVATYLGRQPAPPTGLVAQTAWIVVSPQRAPGHRALGAVPAPSLPGFTTLRALELHGFRLVLAGARRPTPIVPEALTDGFAYPGSP